VIRFTPLLILIFCSCQTPAFVQAERSVLFPTAVPEAANLFPNSFAGISGVQKDSEQPSKKLFALEFGPKLLELKASYFERRQEEPAAFHSFSDKAETKWGTYADLLATSAHFGGKLAAEAQAAYSTLAFRAFEDQQPVMTRLGLHGRWGKAGYGLSYRSTGRGFVSTDNLWTDHSRDEGQVWGEYDLGLFRVRGAFGEMWEENSETHQVTLTKTTATSVYLNRPGWSAALSSSYSTAGNDDHLGQKTLAVTNGVSFAYRFASLFKLEPNLSFKQEWAPITRLKTDTPLAGVGLAFTPSRELQLIGRASYARDMSQDPLRTGSIMNAAAGLNWNLGKSFIGQQSLSLQLEYKNELRPTLPENQQTNLIGMVQFKILGF
jgi:hypothetical protein